MLLARPYTGEADFAAIRHFLVEIHALAGPPVYCTVGDLDWWCWTDDDPDSVARMRLWEDGRGRIAAIAWPAWPRRNDVDIIVHPRHVSAEFEAEILAWAEAERRQGTPGDSTPVEIVAWTFTGDVTRQAALERRGYERTSNHPCFRMHRLNQVPPERALPPGYTLRHVVGEADLEQRVAVHRDAFAPSRMTVDKHRAVMQAATYRPELDLVVVAPDATFAAFALVWFDEVNQIGVFEPVGCHSAHRRQGLTRALLNEGLRRLTALGAHAAYVNSGGGDPAPNRLYESAGFQVIDRKYAWKKQL